MPVGNHLNFKNTYNKINIFYHVTLKKKMIYDEENKIHIIKTLESQGNSKGEGQVRTMNVLSQFYQLEEGL